MPMVGGMRFPYTPAGKKKAAQRAKKVGKPIEMPKKDAGRGKMVPMPKKGSNLNKTKKTTPSRPGLKKKQLGKYGQVGRV